MPSKSKRKPAKSAETSAPEPTLVELPIVGHQGTLDQLRRAIAHDRLGHAFLFVGRPGIGKRRIARQLSAALLCERNAPEKIEPCGECSSCHLVKARTHPDQIEVSKPADKSEFPISVIHELVGHLSLKPARGQTKIALLDDADTMNAESANALLKTLEEPPPGSVLILLASSLESQLPTIQSRCQVIRFRDLTHAEVAGLLLSLGAAQGSEDADRLARLGDGSLGDALFAATDVGREFEPQLRQGLGELPRGTTESTATIQMFIDDAGKESAAKRGRAKQVIRMALSILRQNLGASCQQSHQEEIDRTLDLIERTLEAETHVGRMASLPITIEAWIDDLGRIAEGRYLPSIR